MLRRRLSLLLLLFPMLTAFGAAQTPNDVANLALKARADSNDPMAHFALAVAYLERKQYADGEVVLNEAIAIDPQFAPGYFHLSAIPRKLSVQRIRVDVGGTPFEILVFGNDSVSRESRRLARIAFYLNPLLDLGRPGPGVVPLAWKGGADQAMDDFRARRFQEAHDRLSDLISRSKGKADSVATVFLWYRALCAARMSRFDDAIKDLDRLRPRAGHDDASQKMFARTWFSPDDYGFVIAFLHQLAGHRDDAVRGYQELLERNIGLYTAHIRLAELHEQAQDWPRAVAERQRAVETNPDDPSLVYDLGATLQRAGRNAEAAEELQRAIQLNPRETRAYHALGLAQLALDRPADARTTFERFIALAPSRYQSQLFDAKWRLAQIQ